MFQNNFDISCVKFIARLKNITHVLCIITTSQAIALSSIFDDFLAAVEI